MASQSGSPTGAAALDRQAHGFDFILGTWRIQNRRLSQRLQPSQHWEEFETVSTARPLWDGVGNVDEIVGESPSGPVRGLTVRLFDPAAQLWRLYWATRRGGLLEPPMVGRFEKERGLFYNQELFEGQPVFVRFVYSHATEDSCRWEQAFSADGGSTWEPNWQMEFRRAR